MYVVLECETTFCSSPLQGHYSTKGGDSCNRIGVSFTPWNVDKWAIHSLSTPRHWSLVILCIGRRWCLTSTRLPKTGQADGLWLSSIRVVGLAFRRRSRSHERDHVLISNPWWLTVVLSPWTPKRSIKTNVFSLKLGFYGIIYSYYVYYAYYASNCI